MRAKLGESLSTIQGENRAYQHAVTTSSLEALQAFNMGDEEWSKTGEPSSGHPVLPPRNRARPKLCDGFRCPRAQWTGRGERPRRKKQPESRCTRGSRQRARALVYRIATYYAVRGTPEDSGDRGVARQKISSGFDVSFKSGGCLPLRQVNRRKRYQKPKWQSGTAPGFSRDTSSRFWRCWDLNRLDEAKATLQETISKGLDRPLFHLSSLNRIRPRRCARPSSVKPNGWRVTRRGQLH